MKLCCSYKISPKLWEKADEIRFSVPGITSAIAYLEKYPDKRVIIEILNLEVNKLSTDKIHDLCDEYPSMYFDFYELNDLLTAQDERNKYMYHYPANTFNMFYFLLHQHVSDITVTEPLTFDLGNLHRAKNSIDREINIRINPAIGRPELFNQIKDIDDGFKHFWLLPQHMDYYEEDFDVIDLYDENQIREEALFNVFLSGSYSHELHYFVKNCESNIRGKFIDEDFLKRRRNCGQSCFRNSCHFCNTLTQFYDVLKAKQEASDSDNPLEKIQNL